ncbi:MAG: hypothetical protein HC938_17845 [Nitrospira sp.]|nr:hypothetical protein [Nitrospira sp.]
MNSTGQTILGGRAIEGYAVGVLHLNSTYPLPPGNAQHAQSYGFPVAFEPVPISDPWALMKGDPSIAPLIIEACEKLITRGARIIVGACGSFAFFQKETAAAIDIPVFTSVLTQIPFLVQSLGRRRLGVICASASSMTDKIFEQCNVTDPSRLVISQMKGMSEFDAMLTGIAPMDVTEMERQACKVAKNWLQTTPTSARFCCNAATCPPMAKRSSH